MDTSTLIEQSPQVSAVFSSPQQPICRLQRPIGSNSQQYLPTYCTYRLVIEPPTYNLQQQPTAAHSGFQQHLQLLTVRYPTSFNYSERLAVAFRSTL